MERGEVHRITVELPNRSRDEGTIPRTKWAVILRGGSATDWEADVPVVLASSDQGSPRRAHEVFVDTDDGFDRDTVIDCRWVFTIPKRHFGPETLQALLSPAVMREISIALVVGLQMYP